MNTPSPSKPVPETRSDRLMQDDIRRGPVPRQGILRIKPHMVAAQVGDASAGRINLSSNESAWGPSPLALTAAHRALDTIERYPEDAPLQLAQSIGQRYGLNPEQLVVGHGSDELLQRLARGFLNPGDEVIHSARGYLKFPNYAHAMGAVPVAAPDLDFQASVDHMLACVTPRTRMILLANPDNPTGTLLSGTEIRRLHAGLPEHVLLVLDSAYAEYVADPGYELPQALIDSASNVVMTRTFSKIHGLAGMRLGWLYGPGPIVDVLQRLGMTFPVSAPAAAAGIAAVMDREWQEQVKRQNHDIAREFTNGLQALGLRVVPSHTNFVLIDFDQQPCTAQQAFDHLYSNGVVGRLFTAAAYRNMLRITIGRTDEMATTLSAMRSLLNR